MAISREEAFNNIKTIINLWECDEEMFTDSIEISIDQEFINTMYKAISDMEKLKKIEHLYGIDKFGKVLTREERDREVQKILEVE